MDINLPISPPINNNIQTSLYDKLDAIAFDKIRVVNTQLDSRLSLQEKTLNKHRKDVERTHMLQTQRLRREVKKIRQKKPDYVFDDSDISTSKSRITSDSSRPRSLSECNNLSYCRRFYAHHYNVKDPTRVNKKDQEVKKEESNDFFNLKLRLYFVNMMNQTAQHKTKLEHDDDQGYNPFPGRDLKGDELSESYGSEVRGRFYTQSSVDYESDDVFEHSHGNFKTAGGSYDHKLEDINDAEETNVDEDIAMIKSLENDTEFENKVNQSGKNHVELRRHSDMPRDGRQRPGRRSKRRNTEGPGLNCGHENDEANRRKSKHAFEKIFAGLL